MSWLLYLSACCIPLGSPLDRSGGSSPPPEPPPVPAPAPPPAPKVDLAVPLDANVLTDRLGQAERSIRDPALSEREAALWGHLQQRIYRVLADDEVLAGAVMGKLAEALKADADRALHGTRQIARTVLKPKTDLPNWHIVEARPASELLVFYKAAGQQYGVPWTVLASIHLNETRMGRLRGASDVGARGPMQFMPETWEKYGEGDIEDPRAAIFAAAKYLDAKGWQTNPRGAIWAYNRSNAYVDAILDFAAIMDADENAYRGLWGWQVYYRTVQGSIWLEEGYAQEERIAIETYCAPRGEPHCPVIHAAP